MSQFVFNLNVLIFLNLVKEILLQNSCMINIKSSVVEVGLNLLSFKYFLFRASPFDQRQRQHLCQKYRMDENTYRPNDVKIKSHFFTSYTQLQQISRYLDCVKDDATYIYCEGNNNIIVHIITLLYYWNVPASEPKQVLKK